MSDPVPSGRGIQVGDHNVQVNVVIGAEPDATAFAADPLLPDEYSPSSLLRGDYEVVPFTGRTAELKRLTRWCEQGTRNGVALLSGPGGQGKTRLARQVCHQRAAAGWTTGFLHPDAGAGDVLRLAERDTPLLLVMDYAETRAAQITGIGRALAALPGGRARLLLLARAAGDWWTKLCDYADDMLATLLDSAARIDLGPAADTAADRRASFEGARDAFAARLKMAAGRVAPPPDLEDDRYGLMLTVHMSALALLLDGSGPPPAKAGPGRDPARRVLAHERRYWDRTWAARDFAGPPVGTRTLGQIVAVATLFGAASPGVAQRLLMTIPDLADQPRAVIGNCLRWAAAVHPGADALNPLQPDLLGEDHVAMVLNDGPRQFDEAFAVADEQQVRRAITVLGRAASRHPAMGQLLRDIMARDPAQLLVTGTEVAVQLRDPAPLADAITESLPALTDLSAVLAMLAALPRETVALADLAVRLTRVAVAAADVSGASEADRAALRIDLATRLAAVDDHEDALAQARHAVATLRRAAGDQAIPLATALSTQAAAQVQLGMPAEAAGAYREAVSLCDGVEGAEHLLARCLSNSALLMTGMPDAVTRSERAVGILAGLARAEPPDQHLDYAMALDNHVSVLTVAGRYPEAMTVARGAERTLRPLAELRPDSFRLHLSGVLGTIGGLCGHVGQPGDGLRPTQEAVRIIRDLAASKPGRFDLQLIRVLRTYAGVLCLLDHHDQAFDVIAEEAALCRSLVRHRPGPVLVNFERTAGNLAAVATRASRHAQALAILRDAETQLRHVPVSRAREDVRGAIFLAIGQLLQHAGDHAAAVDACRKAVAALRPGTRGDRLALAFAFLASSQAYAKDPVGAAGSARVAAAGARALDPAFEPEKANIARALMDMATPLSELRLYDTAEECTGHAVALAREVAARNEVWEHDLAVALYRHAVVLCGQSRLNRQRWLAELDEAISMFRRQAGASAMARDDLARARRFREAALTGTLGAQTVAAPAGRSSATLRPGRNEPCPCGSGRKYKKCCGAPPGALRTG